MRFLAFVSLAAVGFLAHTPVLAHEYWLSPSSYRVPVGQTLAVQAYVGSDFKGELRPFATTRTVRLEAQAKDRIDIKSKALNGDLDLAHLTMEDDGGIVVAFETNFVPVELAADKFMEYLRREGLEGPLKAREALGDAAGPGRERYLRCAKVWINGNDFSRLEKPFGMPLEIIPRENPLQTGRLTVQLLFQSRPIEGVLVKAWNRPLANAGIPQDPLTRAPAQPNAQIRTDQNGNATLQIDSPGEWLISAVHMQASEDKQVADWESRWASLTFAKIPQ